MDDQNVLRRALLTDVPDALLHLALEKSCDESWYDLTRDPPLERFTMAWAE